jgi:hypothetical protein
MVITNDYTLYYYKDSDIYFVKPKQTGLCPICFKKLRPYGRRNRIFFLNDYEKKVFSIRRLRCCFCRKIHHELPSVLVPFKRHCRRTVQSCIDSDKNKPYPRCCAPSTVSKIKKWYKNNATYFFNALIARKERYHLDEPLFSSMDEFRQQKTWLKKLVFNLVNYNLWIKSNKSKYSCLQV